MLGSEAGPCLPKLCHQGARSEECRTRLLSGHNISASAGLDKTKYLDIRHFQNILRVQYFK